MCIALFAVFMWVYYSTRENSGFRGVVTYLGHLLIFILGWSLGGWIGLALISMPVLAFYYYMLFHLAMVVVPVNDPNNLQELWQRFLNICMVPVGIPISELDGN